MLLLLGLCICSCCCCLCKNLYWKEVKNGDESSGLFEKRENNATRSYYLIVWNFLLFSEVEYILSILVEYFFPWCKEVLFCLLDSLGPISQMSQYVDWVVVSRYFFSFIYHSSRWKSNSVQFIAKIIHFGGYKRKINSQIM